MGIRTQFKIRTRKIGSAAPVGTLRRPPTSNIRQSQLRVGFSRFGFNCVLSYSSRRTCMGSTREARIAGIKEAAAATTKTRRITAESVGTSVGETP